MQDIPNGGAESWFVYMIGGLITAIASMASGLVAMWKINESKNTIRIADNESRIRSLQEHSQKCEDDRERLGIACARMEERLAVVESKVEPRTRKAQQ